MPETLILLQFPLKRMANSELLMTTSILNSLSLTPEFNASVTLGYFFDNDAQGAEEDIFNLHGSYQVGKAMLAPEFITADDDAAGAGEGNTMLLLDYDFTDKLGGAIRYSGEITAFTRRVKN